MSHAFEEKTFSQLTFCDNCKQLLWGLRHQGLRCKDCSYTCHHNCQKTAAKCSFTVSQGFLKDNIHETLNNGLRSTSRSISPSDSKAEMYLKRLSRHNGIDVDSSNTLNQQLKEQEAPSASHGSTVSPCIALKQAIDLAHLRAIITSQKLQNIVIDAIVDNPIPLNSYLAQQPPLNPQTTTVNFTRFVSRCGPVFAFRDRLLLLLSWENPFDTFVVLLSYCLICLYPKLLLFMPQCVLIYFTLSSHRSSSPLSSLATTKNNNNTPPPPLQQHLNNLSKLFQPAIENSPEYLRNLQNLQNNMGEFSDLYDWILLQHANYFDWSFESRTLVMIQALLLSMVLLALTLYFIPVRYIFLVSGIAVFILNTRFAKYIIHELAPYWARFQQQNIQAWKTWYVGLADSVQVFAKEDEVSVYENQRWCFNRQRYTTTIAAAAAAASQTHDAIEMPDLSDYAGNKNFGAGDSTTVNSLQNIPPPQGYQWEGDSDWALDVSGPWIDTTLGVEILVRPDKEGWVYCDGHWRIQQHVSAEENNLQKEGSRSANVGIGLRQQTRRRRWYRKCRKL